LGFTPNNGVFTGSGVLIKPPEDAMRIRCTGAVLQKTRRAVGFFTDFDPIKGWVDSNQIGSVEAFVP
jgi:hypothetical protein